jgi:hypothetical protein
MGGAYVVAEKYADAIESYRRALTIKPNFTASRNELRKAEEHLSGATKNQA